MKRGSNGFTLVEILIVVIILGILAAIVIPQFSSASSDARNSSVEATLQTLRSQIGLFQTQHNDTPPASAGSLWAVLGGMTTSGDTVATDTAGTLGPYVQSPPVNPLNGSSSVGSAAGAGVGWVYTVGTLGYTLSATDSTGMNLLTY